MKRKNFQAIGSQILLIIGIVVVVNILAKEFYFRLDFTADRRYTLSQATKNILDDLEEPVTITAYFTEDVPSQFIKTREDFRELLVEYGNASDGNVVYEFIDPNKEQELERKAVEEGIMPSIVNVRERDQVSQKRVFFGAVIRLGEKKEIIPLIQPGTAMEYSLSSGIKKLTIKDKPVIAYVTGHGEPPQDNLQQAMELLDILYTVEDADLADPGIDLLKYSAMTIVAPTDTFPAAELAVLDNYLARGGKLVIAYNRVQGDFRTVQGTALYTGLEDWLAEKGLMMENAFVVDANCGTVAVQQQSGRMNFTSQINFPYLPRITSFADHPVTKGLEEVMMPFASPIHFTGDTSLDFTPLAWSSSRSGTQSPPVFFDINKRWSENDFPLSNLNVAAVLSGKLSGDRQSAIVLVADGDFAVNGPGARAQQLQPDNINLLVNSIEWLSDQTGLIDLRTKAVTSRPLDQIEDSKKTLLKWLNFAIPIILVILYGIIRSQRRRKIRIKRMEEGYV